MLKQNIVSCRKVISSIAPGLHMVKVIDSSKVHQISFKEIENFSNLIFTFFFKKRSFVELKFCNILMN